MCVFVGHSLGSNLIPVLFYCLREKLVGLLARETAMPRENELIERLARKRERLSWSKRAFQNSRVQPFTSFDSRFWAASWCRREVGGCRQAGLLSPSVLVKWLQLLHSHRDFYRKVIVAHSFSICKDFGSDVGMILRRSVFLLRYYWLFHICAFCVLSQSA